MQDLLKSLYRVYCERKGQYDLPPEAEDAFQRLIKNLSKENKHLFRSTLKTAIVNHSFCCGFVTQ